MTFHHLTDEADNKSRCWLKKNSTVSPALSMAREMHPLAARLDAGFFDMPRADHALSPVEPLQQYRREPHCPAVDRGMVDADTALGGIYVSGFLDVEFATEPITLLHVHGRSAIICHYGNYTCQLLENCVQRCDIMSTIVADLLE
jgi:hypothetical protein